MGLENKIIVVTGGNGLLGSHICNYLQKKGAVVVSADINQKEVNKLNRVADITNEKSIDELITNIERDFGHIDGWVNNAYPRTKDWGSKFEDILIDSWKANVDMHLNGYFLCCKRIIESMKKYQFGSIVNMSSIYGIVGPDFTIYEGTSMTMPAAYSAIKGGLINFTRYLASYVGSYNIRVNAVSPGGIFDNQPSVFIKQYEKKVPLKRLGQPQDIAPGVAFLLSDEASYITGHNLVIDGGWTAI
ncbi:MAG: SDR family oxidoreductase [Chitinophagaceae bacterium]|nr:SDR family oxidoreductase [Chitinophagaceae bacterium]